MSQSRFEVWTATGRIDVVDSLPVAQQVVTAWQNRTQTAAWIKEVR